MLILHMAEPTQDVDVPLGDPKETIEEKAEGIIQVQVSFRTIERQTTNEQLYSMAREFVKRTASSKLQLSTMSISMDHFSWYDAIMFHGFLDKECNCLLWMYRLHQLHFNGQYVFGIQVL